MQLHCLEVKPPGLNVKTQPNQLLGLSPFDIALTGKTSKKKVLHYERGWKVGNQPI
jgi:hypothetical protein